MGRLIDTDVIEAFIKNHSCCVGTDGELLTVGEDGKWNNLLEYIPTAYDVNKVVEGLETDSSIKLYGSRNSNNYMIPVNRAIKVVKKSGVADD